MAKVKIKSPLGTVKFPKVDINGDTVKFKFGLSFDKKAFEEMDKKVKDAENDFASKYRGKTYFKEDTDYNRETKEATLNGRVLVNFNWLMQYRDKVTGEIQKVHPSFFDAAKKKIEAFELSWNDKVAVAFSLREYDMNGKVGLTRDVAAVQVIERNDREDSADSYGFDEEEGYTESEETTLDPVEPPVWEE